jgi:hypothetical protein
VDLAVLLLRFSGPPLWTTPGRWVCPRKVWSGSVRAAAASIGALLDREEGSGRVRSLGRALDLGCGCASSPNPRCGPGSFYVVDGEIEARAGERTVVGGPGTFVFVPKGVAHSIANRSQAPATFIFFTSPPGHERYFEDLAEVLAGEGPPDAVAIAEVRARHDTEQLSTLRAD